MKFHQHIKFKPLLNWSFVFYKEVADDGEDFGLFGKFDRDFSQEMILDLPKTDRCKYLGLMLSADGELRYDLLHTSEPLE